MTPSPPGALHVLHVSSGNLFGGIERLLLTLATRRDADSRMTPHFALAFDGRVARELRQAGADVHILGGVRTSRPWTILQARRRLRVLLGRQQCDVVVCHAPWPQAVFGPAAKAAGLPLVFWAHGRGRTHWTDLWARLTSPAFAICNSRFTAASLARLYPSCAHAVIYCPVSFEPPERDRMRVREDLQTAQNATVILHVSRLEAGKGHHQLLDALHRLRHRSDWVCWMTGTPQTDDERHYLSGVQRRAEMLGLGDRLRLIPPAVSIANLYGAADIFCQANTEPDSFGLVFIEAMLHGLPVVTSDLGGPREFVDDSCGRLVPPGDVARLATSLETLFDAGLRGAMSAAGIAKAAGITAPVVQLPLIASTLEGAIAQVPAVASRRKQTRSSKVTV